MTNERSSNAPMVAPGWLVGLSLIGSYGRTCHGVHAFIYTILTAYTALSLVNR